MSIKSQHSDLIKQSIVVSHVLGNLAWVCSHTPSKWTREIICSTVSAVSKRISVLHGLGNKEGTWKVGSAFKGTDGSRRGLQFGFQHPWVSRNHP